MRPELIKKAYKIYKIEDSVERKKRADDLVARHHNQWTKVKFLGVRDTVDALGLPIKSLMYTWSTGFHSSDSIFFIILH